MPITCESRFKIESASVPGPVTFMVDLLASPDDVQGDVEFEIVDPANCVHFPNGTKRISTRENISAGGTRLRYGTRFEKGPGNKALVFAITATVTEQGVYQCSRTADASVQRCDCPSGLEAFPDSGDKLLQETAVDLSQRRRRGKKRPSSDKPARKAPKKRAAAKKSGASKPKSKPTKKRGRDR